MDILFLIDRVELKYFEFNNLVTNFWIIRELIRKNNNVFITTIDKLGICSERAYTHCFSVFENHGNILYDRKEIKRDIESFPLVLYRNDPPVDIDYINATYVFDFVDRNKTFASKKDILEFLDNYGEIVLKPLNKCFGSGVMTLKKGDKNTAVIINSMTNNETGLVMVQRYLEKAKYGDKRVLFLGDEVLPYCVQKLPSNDDFKFNEHCDKNIIKAVLTDEDVEKFKPVAVRLNSMGIYMTGLDVIDGKIIEINVTSPCYFIKEINHHFGIELEKTVTDYILSKVSNQSSAEVYVL